MSAKSRATPGGRTLWCQIATLALLSTVPAAAQGPSVPRLSLEEVVTTVLGTGVELRLAHRQLAVSRAGVSAATSPFEPVLKVATSTTTERALTEPTASTAPFTVASTSTKYAVSVDKLFRSGIVITPSVGVTRSEQSTSALPPPNRASVSMGVTMPMLRGWNGGALRASERAAGSDASASELDLRHAAAKSVLAAVAAYWDYAAAYERLEVFRNAERRAAVLVDETNILVRADERSPSELHSLVANAAAKRAPRIAAEQAVLEARQRLGIALGVPADAIRRLGRPETEFPTGAELHSPEDAQIDTLTIRALERRADVGAANARRSSAAELSSGYAHETKPKLDLVVTVGYTGMERGSSVQQYYSALNNGVAGLNSSVLLSFQPWLGGAGARSRVEQAEAVLERSGIVASDVARAAVTATYVAVEGLRSARLQLEASEEAVMLSRKSIESEMTKFRNGMSTRFDVIQAEDALTGSLLSRIAAQTQCAQALAKLRFESGRLVQGIDHTLRVDVESLLRVRSSEW